VGADVQAVRRSVSLTRPWMLVARRTRWPRSRDWQAAAMRAAFSFSAGDSSGAVLVLRRDTLAELTEREVAREDG
jgi:hypothetical protein